MTVVVRISVCHLSSIWRQTGRAGVGRGKVAITRELRTSTRQHCRPTRTWSLPRAYINPLAYMVGKHTLHKANPGVCRCAKFVEIFSAREEGSCRYPSFALRQHSDSSRRYSVEPLCSAMSCDGVVCENRDWHGVIEMRKNVFV